MIMLVTSLIGGFVSNTGTVAVMLPIVVSLAFSAEINPGRLLMPLAFASSLGHAHVNRHTAEPRDSGDADQRRI